MKNNDSLDTGLIFMFFALLFSAFIDVFNDAMFGYLCISHYYWAESAIITQ